MKKLRRKIVLAVFASTAVVFLLTVLALSLTLQIQTVRRTDSITNVICKNGGKFPDKATYEQLEDEERIYLYSYSEESQFRLRYFVVYFDPVNGELRGVDVEHIAAQDTESAEEMARNVLAMNKPTGYYGDYRYRVAGNQDVVLFLDVSEELSSIRIITFTLIGIALLFIAAITVIFHFVSKLIVRPFEENAKMQKQFITDASHELKTPLAIISANAEVLAYKEGENEWLNNITEQVDRTSELVNELLTLNRLEEIDTVMDIERVDLSAIVEESCSDFEQVFSAKNVAVTQNIRSDVVLNGNKNQLKRLVSVLVENASKYATDGGEVRIELKSEGRYTHFNVFNTCEIQPDIDYKHLFDRFYRPDSSRTSKTGGHGIGLSIAKRIATLHNGSIEAVPEKDGLSFRVKLSNRIKLPKQKKD